MLFHTAIEIIHKCALARKIKWNDETGQFLEEKNAISTIAQQK
ncbi:hypothetical protein AB47_2377 [Escherichia coli 3-373-03_S1_C2]|nr:hypothetical protein AB47_2377 [Escherichia coli 3-373-03_S1_C2]